MLLSLLCEESICFCSFVSNKLDGVGDSVDGLDGGISEAGNRKRAFESVDRRSTLLEGC